MSNPGSSNLSKIEEENQNSLSKTDLTVNISGENQPKSLKDRIASSQIPAGNLGVSMNRSQTDENLSSLLGGLDLESNNSFKMNPGSNFSKYRETDNSSVMSEQISSKLPMSSHGGNIPNSDSNVSGLNKIDIAEKYNAVKNEYDDILRQQTRKIQELTKIISDYKISESNSQGIPYNESMHYNQMMFMQRNDSNLRSEPSVIESNSNFMSPMRSVNSSQTVFSGKSSEDVDAWLYTLDLNLDVANIPERLRVSYAGSYMKDQALQYFRQIKSRKQNINWIEFQKEFKKRFRAPDYDQKLLRKVMDFKQIGSISKYVDEFTLLVNQITEITEEMKVIIFRKNIDPDIDGLLSINDPKTLDEAINFAIKYGETIAKKSSDIKSVNYIQKYPSKNVDNITCYNCRLKGHYSTKCPAKNNSKSDGGKQFKYNNKFNNGNKRYSKYNNGYNNNSNNNKSNGSQPNNSNQNAGNNLRQSAHNFNGNNDAKSHNEQINLNNGKEPMDCGRVMVVNACFGSNDRQLRTMASLNGNDFEVLIDSGADISVISYKAVKKYNIPFGNTDILLRMANDQNTKPIGITDEVILLVHGVACSMRLVILEREEFHVLLGTDWQYETNATVNIRNKLLIFGTKAIQLSETSIENGGDDLLDIQCALTTLNEETDVEEEHWVPEKLQIPYVENLNSDENNKFKALLTENIKVFAQSLDDLKEPCKFGSLSIKVTCDKPIFTPPYRRSEKEKELIDEEINRLLKAKIIRPSKSPWSAPVILVPKKDGSSRLCIDYRKLNKVTVKYPLPMPRIDDILDKLKGVKIFTIIDLKSGYYQLRISEDSIEYAAFSTHSGHFESDRAQMGLANAPAEFVDCVNLIFQPYKSFVITYFDDIIICSESIEQHFHHLSVVFAALIEANLKINAKKCQWFKKEVKVLGHVVKENEIKMDQDKIKAIQEWKIPKNIKQLQQFIGLCSYYRRFIKGFASIAAPLYALFKKEKHWKWSDDCQKSFDLLKEKLTSYPVLRQPDFSKPFYIYTDASGVALGAVLSQKDENNKEYVCYYWSWILKGAELHYTISEKECFAIIKAIKFFRIYIFGVKFYVITDHAALVWLMSIKDPVGKLARWAIYLQAHNFEIIHRAGRKHSNVDGLSRSILALSIADSEESMEDEENANSKLLDPYEDDNLLYYLQFGNCPAGLSRNQVNRVKRASRKFVLNEDIIYYNSSGDQIDYNLIVPRKESRKELILEAHHLGHFAVQETYIRLKSKYYWKNMFEDVKNTIKRCLPCLRNKQLPSHEHPALALPITGLHQRVGVDLIQGLPVDSKGYRYILVITEYLSKYPIAYPVKSKEASEISRCLFEYISVFGPPMEILSDQGTEFLNKIIDNLLNRSGIERRTTSSYNPRTNGLVENFNKTLVSCLRKHCEENPLLWASWIPYVLMAYRSRINPSTKRTPFELVFGRTMNGFENWKGRNLETEEAEISNRAVEIRNQFECMIPEAIENIENAQVRQRRVQDQRAGSHLTEEEIPIGSIVMVKAPGILNKLAPRFYGPYTITGRTENGNYKLKNSRGVVLSESYPINKLKLTDLTEGEVDKRPIVEIEGIIDSRVVDGEKQYLVKWKNYPPEENEWLKRADFETTEIIDEYEESVRDVAMVSVSKNKKKRAKSSIPKHIALTIIFISFFVASTALKINSNFKYCQVKDDSSVVMFDDQCKHIGGNYFVRDRTLAVLEKKDVSS